MKGKEKSFIALKWLVISLGCILLGGMLLIGVTLFKRGASSSPAEPVACIAGDLPITGTIRQLSLEGTTLAVLIEEKDRTQRIEIIDYCSGRSINTLAIGQ